MTSSTTETITLGGGCFWCTEAVFDRVQGVTDVESGYSNGDTGSFAFDAYTWLQFGSTSPIAHYIFAPVTWITFPCECK